MKIRLINLIWSLICAFACSVILLLFDTIVNADEYVFDVQEMYVNYHFYAPGGVDPLTTQNGLPNRTMGQGAEFNVKTRVFQHLYWDNRIHTTTDKYIDSGENGQFRTVGLETRFGVRLHDNLDIGYYHHSEHVLDYERTSPFPRRDAFEVRFYLYNAKPRQDVIIP